MDRAKRVAPSKVSTDDIICDRNNVLIRVRAVDRTDAGTWFFGVPLGVHGAQQSSRFIPRGGRIVRYGE